MEHYFVKRIVTVTERSGFVPVSFRICSNFVLVTIDNGDVTVMDDRTVDISFLIDTCISFLHFHNFFQNTLSIKT
jgi:hypothetical protein